MMICSLQREGRRDERVSRERVAGTARLESVKCAEREREREREIELDRRVMERERRACALCRGDRRERLRVPPALR